MKFRIGCALVGLLSFVLSLVPLTLAQTPTETVSALPRLVRFSGTVKDLNGTPLTGVVGMTFALYFEQSGGAALWLETQNVTADNNGHYTVLLGSTKAEGLPAELFTSEQAHWVGVQVSGQEEQPRVLLVSAPYALKAGDAETLGGKPASAFVLAAPPVAGAAGESGGSSNPAAGAQSGGTSSATTCDVTSDGTAATNALAKFTAGCNVQGSAISESGGNVGIDTAPSTSEQLYLIDNQSNFGLKWLQRSIFNTTATSNGTNYALALDADASSITISAGVTDNGYRLGAYGRGYADTTGFAGTLAQQFGVNGSAGIFSATSGAKVESAYGGYYEIYNQVPGTTITNAYGLYVTNSQTSGTITNRYDLYASSANAKNYFAGTVGIGTTAPAATLEVNGTAKFDSTVTFAGANTFTGNQNVTGNVTASGEVQGGVVNATTSYDIGGNPFSFGSYANQNAYLGFAGNSNTTNTGSNNSGSGYYALHDNTTGSGNTATGVNALLHNTTGSFNTASGYQALSANAFSGNTTGNYNTAVGYLAGQTNDGSNLTASNNTAVGAGVAFGTGTITNATAIGSNAEVTENNALVLGAITGVNGGTSVNVGIGTSAPAYTLDVRGQGSFSSSTVGANGVYGNNSATSGTGTNGVYGSTASPAGAGTVGVNFSSGGSGVYGQSNGTASGSTGVYGIATASPGTGSTYGVYGTTAGQTPGSAGVYGYGTGDAISSPRIYGVYGELKIADSGAGVAGTGSTISGTGTANIEDGAGVWGDADPNGLIGVLGTADDHVAIKAINATGTDAGTPALSASNSSTTAGALALQAGGSGGSCTVDVNGNMKCTASTAVAATTVLQANVSNEGGLGPTLTLNNSGLGGTGSAASIDFNTYLPSTSGTYNPAARILAYDQGNFADELRFQSNIIGAANGGLQTNMVITESGFVGIGTLSPDNLLTVNGAADKVGGGSWGTFSDGRLKNLNGSFNSGLSQILKIRPVRYRYKPDNALGIRDTEEHIGVVAQEVERVIPEAVTKNNKGYLLVNNDPIIWSMLNAIKEQQQEIQHERSELAKALHHMRSLEAEVHEARETLRKVKAQVATAQPALVAAK